MSVPAIGRQRKPGDVAAKSHDVALVSTHVAQLGVQLNVAYISHTTAVSK